MTNLKTRLFPHQEMAFHKLKDLKVGALFMDMGTGKTRTIFEIFEYKRQKNKVNNFVYVCPYSTRKNIELEIEKHFIEMPKYKIFAYESIQSSNKIYFEFLKNLSNDTMLILDESHFIKNNTAKRTFRVLRAAQSVSYKFILTGTPSPKHAGDLYSQFEFLDKRILGYPTYNQFVNAHLEMDIDHKYVVKSHNLDYITAKIMPYTYQVKKKECVELPEKLQYVEMVKMDIDSLVKYNDTKQKFLDSIFNFDYVSETTIFAMYTSLQKVCDMSCNKYAEMLKVIKKLDGKIILYFKFLDSMYIAKEILDNFKYDTYMYNGCCTIEERNHNLEDWKKSEKGILLITYGTGAFSLNLQESHSIIFMNLTFDYSRRIQSEDRIHRIGQKYPCEYIEICTNSGVEDIIQKSIAKKINFIKMLTQEINELKEEKGKDTRKELETLWEKYT